MCTIDHPGGRISDTRIFWEGQGICAFLDDVEKHVVLATDGQADRDLKRGVY